MQSRTEVNFNLIANRQPRGYFKKRKLQENLRPPDTNMKPHHDRILLARLNLLFTFIVAFSIISSVECVQGFATTIEPSLKVLSLQRPTAPNNYSIAENSILRNGSGICGSLEIRFDLKLLERLQGCRVVEGSVYILLIEAVTLEEVSAYSFPDLVEITGFLLLYRMTAVKTLQKLFPNLAVIRGRELFYDYSLIIYEFDDLEEIGLINLQKIVRGAVRIEKNNKLCFADRIDWSSISENNLEHYIDKNKLARYCPHCNKEMKCPALKEKDLCWNQQHCQLRCPMHCNNSGCYGPEGRQDLLKCCDSSCLGGCDERDPTKCKACKKFIISDGENMRCSDRCPNGTYAYHDRRCVTRQECYDLNPPRKESQENQQTFIPFEGVCMMGCPLAYEDFRNGTEIQCKKCGSGCLKRCSSKIIDSIAAAHQLKGCAIIEGPLEIQIRKTTKISPDTSNNVVRELEIALSDIVEITDYLKIARTFPIVSLSFLKKLKTIRGKRLESNKYSLVIWDNQNLQTLWDDKHEVEIENGKLFFHFNPKLCFYKIEELAKNISQIEHYDTAKLSNGDKIPCNVTSLTVTLENVFTSAALLSWPPLKMDDDRALLSYVVYYIPAVYNNVTLWDGRDACGNDGWMVDDVNDFVVTDAISFPLTNLEPYTQYAFYVRAYTLSTENVGAQSEIQYLTTKPGKPQAVVSLDANPKTSSTIEVTWEKPKKVNGKLSHYIIRAKMILKNDQLLEQRDYCVTPFEQSEGATKTDARAQPEKKKTSIIDGHCDCNTCQQTCSKGKDGDDQRQSAIDFEDQIQDLVYIKNTNDYNDFEPISEVGRSKRQALDFPFRDDGGQSTPDFPDPERILNEQNVKNKDGEYESFIDEIKNPSDLTYVIPSLRHYTSYQIFLRACREKPNNSVISTKEHDHGMSSQDHEECGPETVITVTTLRKEENDKISTFRAENVVMNQTHGIKVTWTAPGNPNGLLLTYTIRYKRNDIESAKWDSVCIPHKIVPNETSTMFHLIRQLNNGNYSVQIQATSMAGTGNWSASEIVLINENKGFSLWIIAGVGLLILMLLVAGFIYYMKCHYIKNMANMKLIASVNPDYAGVQYKLDDWEVARENIDQLHELGQGSFGMVYEGIIKDLKIEGSKMRCAIKTVNENATDKERVSFLNEASVMKQFDTAFVVRLLGVVSQSQPTFVVMELMINGDLKGYLRSHRPEYDNGSGTAPTPPTLRQILQMAAEIADGMSYLSAKKFVHRDLAARNCMVAEDLSVKIGDFGMTRDIYETDYYRKGTKGLLPVRWMSPESLKDGVFTSSSDVFSYGVVLWEISTLASQPYQGLSNDQVLRYVIEGGVMERPENCPDKLYELMRSCWQHRPSARPTFIQIIEQLLEDVNQNFRNIAFYFSKEAQDILNQQRQGDYAVNMTDDVTTPLRQDEEETSSVDGNHFLMDEMNSDNRFHEL